MSINHGKMVVKWWLNGGLMGFYGIYPLVMTSIAVENGLFMVDFPRKTLVIVQMYVKLPEGICW